jgi:N-ethylmaleimide reductase
MASVLFTPFTLGPLNLPNRIVMAPMTRNRSPGNVPGRINATYYSQRASAGLIVTEGTAPHRDGLGYARIPGLFNPEQVEGWRLVTEAVHTAGGRIFVQFMHTGRIGHPANLPPDARVIGPSAVVAKGSMWTDSDGLQPFPVPVEMTEADVADTIGAYAHAARLALLAGFDGVELHGANGYLIEQFLNPGPNRRTDRYGGSAEGRNRFALEVATAVSAAIGPSRTGIRLSPHGVVNDVVLYEGIDEQYNALARSLSDLGLAYIHLVDHSSMGAPKPPDSVVTGIRQAFRGALILSGGYDAARAQADVSTGRCDLVAFGKPFLANPDLPERIRTGAALNAPDQATFYSGGPKGYTDYPTLGT